MSVAFLLMIAGARVPAIAQVSTASVSGVVKDSQGGVVPGAALILINENQGTKSATVTSADNGDFVFATVAPGLYTLEISLTGFKTMRRPGIVVSPADRLTLGTVTIEIGGATEVIDVAAQAPLLQSGSGERSHAVNSVEINNLPVGFRTAQAFGIVVPGVVMNNGTPERLGGGGGNNYMMDGVVNMDPGSGTVSIQINPEAIAEVKVLTSGYQAEYGRASGLQVTAVTKSGTNTFRGSVYDVERNSRWNAVNKATILNGDPVSVTRERDWGFSLGGPIGRPGGKNKLFFFYSQEFNPRTAGNDVRRFRVPTALERQGDFSRTYDNNGALYPYIKNPALSGRCDATNTEACFADGGVLGRIPASALYQAGLAILNWWPLPNIDGAGLGYNLEIKRPLEKALGFQPVVKVDYQPTSSLRLTGKYAAYGQTAKTFLGSMPGFTDSRPSKMLVPQILVSGSYALTSRTFLEGSVGRSVYQQEGCAFVGASLGPQFCTNSIPMSPLADYRSAGFGDLPTLFPNARVLDPETHYGDIFDQVKPPFWDGTTVWRAPTFGWGGRVANAPPNPPFPGYFQLGGTWDLSLSVTHVVGRHTIKAGYYFQSELHEREGGNVPWQGDINFGQDTVGVNPFDTSFGFSNAAIGSFSAYTQVNKFLEGKFVYFQNDFYIQDNWKVTPRLTLDYGMRFVNQGVYHDARRQTSNFFNDRWSSAAAPVLYIAGCANGPGPCTGLDRQALNPLTGQLLGPGSAIAIGTIVPNSGDGTNGLVLAGEGIANTGFKWPALGLAPRFGFAYGVDEQESLVIRGGAGLFYDRLSANAGGTYSFINNPPITQTATVRYNQLQTLTTGGLSTIAPPTLQVNQYDSPLPASLQFNIGVQKSLPWSITLDAGYVGQRAYNTIRTFDLNSIDIGAAFLPSTQDPTAPPNPIPGARSFVATNFNLTRPYPGYANINQRLFDGWRRYHSLELALRRRFRDGFSFGFSDTIALSDKQRIAPRLEHPTLGTTVERADQAEAQELLGNLRPRTHVIKGYFVWDLPDITHSSAMLRTVGVVANGWQLSGVWTGLTGADYTVGYSYQNGGSSTNLTGSPSFGARIRVVGDPGRGCSDNAYRQFNTEAFQGPAVGSVGLESGNGYLRGCFDSVLDLAIARNISLGGGRNLQLRLDMFNAPNRAGITARNTTLALASPTDPVTNVAPVFDPVTGQLNVNRSLPKNAGFGVATGYQAARSLQMQIRFTF